MSPDCIWIRVEENRKIGSGHFVRCFALAVQLQRRGAEVVFAYAELAESSRDKLAARGIRQVQLPGWTGQQEQVQDAEAVCEELPRGDGSEARPIMVVDVYALDARWHTRVRPLVKQLCVIDDLSNRAYDCDFLVDATLGKALAAYSGWVSPHCELLLGPEYALLREQFVQRFQEHPRNNSQKAVSLDPWQVLVTMGAADDRNATEKVVKALRDLPQAAQLNVTVILGGSSPHVQTIGRVLACAKFQEHRLLQNVSNMAERMAPMDLCVSAGGFTLWECCALGVPTLAIQTADNQRTLLSGLDRAEALVAMGDVESFSRRRLSRTIRALLEDESRLRQLSIRARSLCDGLGAERVSARLLGTLPRKKAVPA